MSDKKEVLIVGFGAVGAIYAFIIKRSGMANVTCVARGNYEVTQADGIHIQSRKYGEVKGWKPDRLFRTVADAADRAYSYVLVATKAIPQIITTHSLLGPLISPDNPYPLPTFVILQNGLSVEKDLYEAIRELSRGEPSIISTALWIGTNLLEGNVVNHPGPERLSVGIYRPTYSPKVINTSEEAITLQDFSQILEASDSSVLVLDEIQSVKFKKNIWNAALASCATLVRHPLPAFVRDTAVEEHVMPQIRAMMSEIIAIGHAMGFDETALPSDTADRIIENTTKIHKKPDSSHRPSMLLDVENGRALEIEVVLGELVRKAKEFRVDAPRLELVYALLSVIQNQLLKQ